MIGAVHSLPSREHSDRERRDAQLRTEQLQNEVERLKNELTHRKEMIFEKEKLIQDVQYKSHEILLERQSVEDRMSTEYKRLNELVEKYDRSSTLVRPPASPRRIGIAFSKMNSIVFDAIKCSEVSPFAGKSPLRARILLLHVLSGRSERM